MLIVYQHRSDSIGNRTCDCDAVKRAIADVDTEKPYVNSAEEIYAALNEMDPFADWSVMKSRDKNVAMRDAAANRRCYCTYPSFDDADGETYSWFLWTSVYPQRSVELSPELVLKTDYGFSDDLSLQFSYDDTCPVLPEDRDWIALISIILFKRLILEFLRKRCKNFVPAPFA